MLNWYNSKVTLELNDLIESGCNPWAFDYPSYYTGAEKAAFEQKVLDHYRFRQIGQETPGRWLHYFRSRIREIMPYYIQLYESQALMQSIEDPFGNVDVTETFEQTSTGERSGSLSRSTSGSLDSTTTGSLDSTTTGSSEVSTTDTENNTGSSTKKFSNTPQGSIENLDSYLTEATIESAENEKTGNGTSSATNEGSQKDTTSSTQKDTSTSSQNDTTQDSESGTIRHTLTKRGNQGVNTYAHDMKELRETFLNIDMMIINELKDLFLMVY